LQSLHHAVSVIKRIRWAVDVALLGEEKNTCTTVIEKPEGKRPLNVDNIKIYLKEIQRRMLTGLNWLKTGYSGGSCEFCVSHSSCIHTYIVGNFPSR
jgi:hypothetical protein